MILAGDIGGTNCRLGVFQDDGATVIREQTSASKGLLSFEKFVGGFLRGEEVNRACFGVAGAVREGVVKMTNLGWTLAERELETSLKIPSVMLINDMVAHAENIDGLRGEQVETIRAGEPVADGGRAIIIPGTGLGEAGLYFDHVTRRRHGFASEGGHCDFAPGDYREEALLQFVRAQKKPASWESLVSGPALRTIYDFLGGKSDLAPKEISAKAVDHSCEICVQTAAMFAALYAAEAGNLALKFCATAGVWLGGGIARTLIDFLRAPEFLARFGAKGPVAIREMLAKIPIHVIKFELNGLYGAASFAARMA